MRRVSFSQAEINKILENKKGFFLKLIRPQPPEHKKIQFVNNNTEVWFETMDLHTTYWTKNIPYPVNSLVSVVAHRLKLRITKVQLLKKHTRFYFLYNFVLESN